MRNSKGSLERKYNIKKKEIRTLIEELKQQLHAKTVKLKRYEERLNQCKINRMYNYLEREKILPEEQKGCKRGSCGTKINY